MVSCMVGKVPHLLSSMVGKIPYMVRYMVVSYHIWSDIWLVRYHTLCVLLYRSEHILIYMSSHIMYYNITEFLSKTEFQSLNILQIWKLLDYNSFFIESSLKKSNIHNIFQLPFLHG